jgi:hypothetical protein
MPANAQLASDDEPDQKPGNKPVANIRYQGVEATIWNNPAEKGEEKRQGRGR